MTTLHAPTDPPRDPLDALGLATHGDPRIRVALYKLLSGASLIDLTDVLRVVYAESRVRRERPGDLFDAVCRGLNVTLSHADMLWPQGLEPSPLAANHAARAAAKGGA